MQEEFKKNNMRLLKLKHVKMPVLNWSNRITNKPEMSHKVVKILLTGEVELKMDPYIGKICQFIMCFNLEKKKIEKLKILTGDAKVSCINYGPYDNGHVMLGMSDGTLLTFEF
jgi:hypothetical protein